MGFFERNLATIGETLDEGLDRARDQTKDLCDREGWTDRAETIKEGAHERAQTGWAHTRSAWAFVLQHWGALPTSSQRRIIGVSIGLGALVIALTVRAIAFPGVKMPTPEEQELVRRLSEQADRGAQPFFGGTGLPSPKPED